MLTVIGSFSWATYACLHTVQRTGVAEALGMLDRLLDKINFSDPAVLKLLREARPPEQTLEQLESSLLSEQTQTSTTMGRSISRPCKLGAQGLQIRGLA